MSKTRTRTHNGAVSYDHSLDHAVEFFSKAGSLYKTKTRKAYYGNANEASALELFKAVWCSGNYEIAMKLLFWLRDARGGAGNRSAFRDCVKWLAETDPDWIKANIDLIPKYGRWDDLRVLFGTDVSTDAASIWSDAIAKKDGLACKWADRTDSTLLKLLRERRVLRDIGEFRRLLAEGRKNVVERQMCSKNWNEIQYPHVPSVAMSRYTKAFAKHDAKRFEKFKAAVEKGEAKINAGVVFPHDLARLVKSGDPKVADLQFDAMPNYMQDCGARIMCICDSSGSMSSVVGGSIQAIDVSTSLSLYCSDRLGKDNPFYRKFIQFESESKFTDWEGMTFSECYLGKNKTNNYWGGSRGIFNGACGSTNIIKALDLILTSAKMFKAKPEQMPNMLLVISDMQFDAGASQTRTPVEEALQKWIDAGYEAPKVVYWDLTGYAGQPATARTKNVGLVSGFSPSILEAVLSAEDFTPKGIMLKKLEKYVVKVPQ